MRWSYFSINFFFERERREGPFFFSRSIVFRAGRWRLCVFSRSLVVSCFGCRLPVVLGGAGVIYIYLKEAADGCYLYRPPSSHVSIHLSLHLVVRVNVLPVRTTSPFTDTLYIQPGTKNMATLSLQKKYPTQKPTDYTKSISQQKTVYTRQGNETKLYALLSK